VSASVTYGACCGVPSITPRTKQRIVGGFEALPNSWPWMCYIQMISIKDNHQQWSQICGATLISATCFITAAHCL